MDSAVGVVFLLLWFFLLFVYCGWPRINKPILLGGVP